MPLDLLTLSRTVTTGGIEDGLDTSLLGTYGWLAFDTTPDFPPPPASGEDVGGLAPIEVLYPIIPERSLNTMLFRTDLKNWQRVQKSNVIWSHEFITIQFRIVKASYMNTFYAFLEANKGNLVQLNIPGVQPFLRTTESNLAYIRKFSKPLRENHVKYRIDVTFLLNPSVSIT